MKIYFGHNSKNDLKSIKIKNVSESPINKDYNVEKKNYSKKYCIITQNLN